MDSEQLPVMAIPDEKEELPPEKTKRKKKIGMKGLWRMLKGKRISTKDPESKGVRKKLTAPAETEGLLDIFERGPQGDQELLKPGSLTSLEKFRNIFR